MPFYNPGESRDTYKLVWGSRVLHTILAVADEYLLGIALDAESHCRA